jgi:uncharacterized protein
MPTIIGYIIIGLLAGTVSGFFGIGGAILIIPALVFFFKLDQQTAQGTTLAMMVPPIGILAAIKYYQQGNVNLQIALFLCVGFFFGAFLGAQYVHFIPSPLLKKLFGVLLMGIALKMIITK